MQWPGFAKKSACGKYSRLFLNVLCLYYICALLGFQVPVFKSSHDASDLKKEIEVFVKAHKTGQYDVLVKMTAAAGQVYGPSAYQKAQLIQKDTEDTFDAINNLVIELTNLISERKSAEEDATRSQRLKVEAEAKMRAAKAEIEAAR